VSRCSLPVCSPFSTSRLVVSEVSDELGRNAHPYTLSPWPSREGMKQWERTYMSDQYLMALDAGTGAGRCLIVDTEGKRAFSAYKEWKYTQPSDAGPYGQAFDPDHFWRCLADSARQALAKANIRPEQIVAVSSTSQRVGGVFLDEDGRELYAGPNVDYRALEEGFALMGEFGQRAYEVSGHYLNPGYLPARLLWYKNKKPNLYGRIAHVLMINDWILFRLCGEYACEPTNASETTVYNLRAGDWEWPLIAEMGLPGEIFPPIRRSGYLLGRVTAQAAQDTGLREGTPVIVGAADTQCGVLGCSAIADADVCAVAGTTTPVQMVLNEVVIDDEARLWTGAYIPENTWVLESNAGSTGIMYRWMRDTLYSVESVEAESTGIDVFQLMSAEAARSPVGSGGVFSFLGPSVMDAQSVQPMIGGWLMTSPLFIQDPNGRRHLLRSQLECMAYGVRANAEQVFEVSGRRPDKMHVCGGTCRSSLWVDILANVMGMPIVVPARKEASAMGAAICAGVGVGVYNDFRQGIRELVSIERVVEPEVSLVEKYDNLFGKWMHMREVLAQIPSEF